MDAAIAAVVSKQKVEIPGRVGVFPYTEERRKEVGISQVRGELVAAMKGAPETVLGYIEMTTDEKARWLKLTEDLAKEGHKVLGVGARSLPPDYNLQTEPIGQFTFSGLLAFEDPARPEVAEAISYCRTNGIGVLMITGDHPSTAKAVAKEIGLGGSDPMVISAESEKERFTTQWLEHHPHELFELDVVARCSPMQKFAIVQAMQKSGALVAVTGDGVNDVPALKAADIGIAMGERGTKSAREVSSIVLADDNFSTIVNAIIEGRQLFLNLQKSFEYLLLIHLPFIITAAVVPLMGYPLLYLPIHIVLLELIIHPSALLAFQDEGNKSDRLSETVQNHRHYEKRSFFSGPDGLRIFCVGLLVSLVVTFVYLQGLSENLGPEHSRSKALALLMIWSAGSVASLSRFRTPASIIIFILTVLSALLVTLVPGISHYLSLSAIHLEDWFVAISAVVIVLVVNALVVSYLRRRS
jgi:Ca2+-transporting ATPase